MADRAEAIERRSSGEGWWRVVFGVDTMTLVENTVTAELPDAKVVVGSLYGSDNDHLEVLVVSDHFEGQPLVRQHQMVLSSLRDVLADELHAIQLKTMTWEKYSHTAQEGN